MSIIEWYVDHAHGALIPLAIFFMVRAFRRAARAQARIYSEMGWTDATEVVGRIKEMKETEAGLMVEGEFLNQTIAGSKHA